MPSKLWATTTTKEAIELPEVTAGPGGSFVDLMYERRSVRSFAPGEIPLGHLAEVLFAAQGITRQNRYRTVPSAGALYPLEVYVVSGAVQGLEDGVYAYRPQGHELIQIASGDLRRNLARHCYGQMWVAEAQAVIIITAVYERVTGKYGGRGERYAHIEAGCAAQNVGLAGYNHGLGSTVVGAFNDKEVAELVQAGKGEVPLIVMPVGNLDE
ncbi:MAG: SagB/ThcOx family dehydrogenase [Desulfovermiculus sp.]|nr:SagB/ThcOx family dehydrogenase [Desulfovermiculus sp.]